MLKKILGRFKRLTMAGRAGAIIATFVILSIVGAATGHTQKISTTQTLKQTTSQKASEDVITHKNVTETTVIPYEIVTENDASLAKGQTKVLTTGINGKQSTAYDITYTNGKETSRTKVSTRITQKPVNEIKVIGTYVAPKLDCPNGTYINTNGSTVCRPYESNTTPTGATAKCVDGTYSFSQHRSGTCSHHGGVSQWL